MGKTYDGPFNMSGQYNSLQAKLKSVPVDHVVYVHCYAHKLNLVLGDTACASVDITKLFGKLQALYLLVSKSQPIHADKIFEKDQYCQMELQRTQSGNSFETI